MKKIVSKAKVVRLVRVVKFRKTFNLIFPQSRTVAWLRAHYT